MTSFSGSGRQIVIDEMNCGIACVIIDCRSCFLLAQSSIGLLKLIAKKQERRKEREGNYSENGQLLSELRVRLAKVKQEKLSQWPPTRPITIN